ncbi:sodium/hydrogen exchanger [Xylona heveae TC161]|uniref:Sodium/hydrogen exchanger n=1 Tax=Xylona heveae (strain CBS 132557 / TC161) TaxID=1328760 RepID=A0A165GST1_XYLHT|nr:sodium/hydrogen exchanger [Xylona heveae TC161]KZF22552.1 sodium/hydrogen exchanger [Xylona heveae TC161]
MASSIHSAAWELMKRQAEDADPDEPEAGQKEILSSWALFILIALLIVALFTSYILQQRKIQAVHETVLSIFAGMIVGLSLRIFGIQSLLSAVSFDYQIFFNLLLPPIILASGYELHQANFFRNIGTILTFAFAGTFISAVVLGLVLFLWTLIPIGGLNISFVEAISVGATLSATDPVTILAIFNTYKVDPKLYTVIFGESILNDAIAIVLFETAQRYRPGGVGSSKLNIFGLFEGVGIFLLVFFGSLLIGVVVGIATALGLKHTLIRRYPKIESCVIVLIAYASYFFSNGLHMSGIVTLLFCGITLKHYAYYNMSRRTQLTTKYLFQVLAQLSENFIFIYLGLSLFSGSDLNFEPLFILITVVGICIARWAAVFPLSRAINWFIRYRAQRRGKEVADELPYSYQVMLFWAGLRGAVGVALAAGLVGENGPALRATVLVVVVLTVIIFGGTTARMLEILGIRTGVVEELDSDDEFDIEYAAGSTYYKRGGTGVGNRSQRGDPAVALTAVAASGNGQKGQGLGSYSSGNSTQSPPARPNANVTSRRNSARSLKDLQGADQSLLGSVDPTPEDDEEFDSDTSDLPPAAARRKPSSPGGRDEGLAATAGASPYGDASAEGSSHPATESSSHLTATGAFSHFFSGASEDHAAWFRQLDEGYIKPKLLLDGGRGGGNNNNNQH